MPHLVDIGVLFKIDFIKDQDRQGVFPMRMIATIYRSELGISLSD